MTALPGHRNPPRSVAFGAASLAPGFGGIARVARLTLRCLREAGIDVDAGSYLDAGPPDDATYAAFGARGSKLRYVAWAAGALPRARVGVYDSLGPARSHPLVLARSWPMLVWAHGMEVWQSLKHRGRQTLAAADTVVFNTQATLSRHESLHGPRPNARVCWLGTEADTAPARKADFSGPPTALIFGRIDARDWGKGHKELIEVWPAVRARAPDARLVIGGGGTGLPRLREWVQASGAADSIEVLGYVPQERVDSLFASAHVFAMPSRQDGFGIVYIEAMRFGLPCIASFQDSGHEVTRHLETGININLTSPSDLTDALVNLLSDRNRAKQLGAQGFDRWQTQFRYSAFAARFLDIWRSRLPRSLHGRVEPLRGEVGE